MTTCANMPPRTNQQPSVPSDSWEGMMARARKRYQRGSVVLSGTRNPAWIGRWREDEITPEGKVRRVCRTQVLGYKRDIPTKKLALRELEARLSQINSVNYKPMRNATFEEFSTKWAKENLRKLSLSTQSSTLSQLRRHLNFFNAFVLRDIQLSVVEHFVARLTCSPKTTRNLVMTMRSIWREAKAQGYVAHDPFERFKLPKRIKPKQRFFTAEEMARIIDAAPEPYKTFYWLAAETGLRAGELCGLEWRDVNLEQCIVQVRQSAWRGRLGQPKTEGSERRLAISHVLAERLQSLSIGRGDLQLVFHASTGRPWDANLVVKRKLHPALRSLGIERAGLHAFRHGNETFMDRQSTPVAVRLSRMGHTDTRMMANYSHPISQDDRLVADGISKVVLACAENQKGLQDVRPVTPVMQ